MWIILDIPEKCSKFARIWLWITLWKSIFLGVEKNPHIVEKKLADLASRNAKKKLSGGEKKWLRERGDLPGSGDQLDLLTSESMSSRRH